MKKFFFLALALAICAFTFVSCEKEKDKDNTSDSNFSEMIVGTWQSTREWDEDYEEWNDYDEDTYTFKENGKGLYDDEDDEYEFKYSIQGDFLYIEYEDGYEAFFIIKSLTSSKMVWTRGDYKIEFKKKK